MLTWCFDEAVTGGTQALPEGFPAPPVGAAVGTLEGFARQVTLNAVRFHLLHEIGPVYFRDDDFSEQLDDERECDQKAVEWMMDRDFADESERRLVVVGSAAAILYIAAYGLDTCRHDGITHSRTYARLIESLQTRFVPDAVWGVATAILSVHAKNQGVEFPAATVPVGGFPNFFACVQALPPGDQRVRRIGVSSEP